MFTCPNWRLFLEENRIRAVILGIPGVGKTTIISEVEGIFEEKGLKAETVVFGSLMFEEAKRRASRLETTCGSFLLKTKGTFKRMRRRE